MYPAIMANLEIPFDLSKAKTIECRPHMRINR